MNNHLFSFGAALLLTFAPVSAAVAAPPPTGEVVIISTGSRLTPGYRVTVQASGISASTLVPRGQLPPIRHTDKMIAATRQRFFSDLAKAEPLPNLPTDLLSASPVQQGGRRRRGGQAAPRAAAGRVNLYPEIFVRYQGRQSPNLRQASTEPGRVLYQDIKQILHVLRMPIPNVP